MQYREFGKTGIKISQLGFGCMRLPEIEKDGKWYVDEEKSTPMLRRAVELGVNYFDTAVYYCHENSEAAVGKALKPFRDKVNISTKIPVGGEIQSSADFRRLLEQSLTRLDTDYIDFYHFWGISKDAFDNRIMKYNLLEEARKAKDEGLIKHMSFSFHDDPSAIKYIIDRAEILESMLVQYNLLDRSNEKMIEYAHNKGLGTVAMGPVAGGKLAAPNALTKKLTGEDVSSSYALAFKFVLGNPSLSCALSGMQNMDMLEKNAALAANPVTISEEEWQQLGESLERLKKFSDLYCTGCNYCQPCPAGINIPHIFNMYTHYNVYEMVDHAKWMWNKHKEDGGKTFKDCKDCGLCEKKCPQHLKIRENLRKVEGVLESL
jgi:predicted aldo/keto reductase-like oxidoreductase